MARYAGVSPELGQRFKRIFYATVDEILVFPEKYAVKIDDVRTRLIRPFPYLVFYTVGNGRVFILTVQFAGRRPSYLRSTIRERRPE